MELEVSVDVDAPPEHVWAELVDVERWPESTPTITSVQRLQDGPLALGSTARIKQPRLPVAVWEVTELQPLRSFFWQAKAPGVRTVGGHAIVPRPDGGATLTLSIRQSGPFAWLAGLLASGLTRRYIQAEADGLKQRCEAAQGAAG